MPRSYETVLILDSVLDESQVEEKLTRFKRTIDGQDGSAVRVDLWGRRKLAYPIQKKEQGIYVVLRYETEPDKLTEFERLTRLDEQVLRQLTVVDPIEPPAPAAAAAPGAATPATATTREEARDEE